MTEARLPEHAEPVRAGGRSADLLTGVHVFEHEVDVVLGLRGAQEANNVGVVELLHQVTLTEQTQQLLVLDACHTDTLREREVGGGTARAGGPCTATGERRGPRGEKGLLDGHKVACFRVKRLVDGRKGAAPQLVAHAIRPHGRAAWLVQLLGRVLLRTRVKRGGGARARGQRSHHGNNRYRMRPSAQHPDANPSFRHSRLTLRGFREHVR